jgi:hypothetical protein
LVERGRAECNVPLFGFVAEPGKKDDEKRERWSVCNTRLVIRVIISRLLGGEDLSRPIDVSVMDG